MSESPEFAALRNVVSQLKSPELDLLIEATKGGSPEEILSGLLRREVDAQFFSAPGKSRQNGITVENAVRVIRKYLAPAT